MEGEKKVFTAVRKASNASKRKGDWANLIEIKAKIEQPFNVNKPVLSVLISCD